MILRPGYQFTPGYRLQKYLGRGQFGQVWQASGPGGVTLAVKFVDLTDGRGKREFAAIDRVKSVRHANLMPIIAIWQLDHEGNVMDDLPEPLEQTLDVFDIDSGGQSGFVSGPAREPATLIVAMSLGSVSLEKFLPKRGEENSNYEKMPPRDLLRCIEGVARGLDFLNSPNHDFGAGPVSLQHCDIKPANIVLIGDSAVICDFGLARILQRTQASMNEPAGTPAYMSPEAIDGTPSQTSDQYSLAITYYHLRTGSLPLADGTIGQVLKAHREGALCFDGVPRAEQQILQRATHLEWRQRFESNTAMVDALRIALNPSARPTQGLSPVTMRPPDTRSEVELMATMESDELTGPIVEQTEGGSLRTKERPNAEKLEESPLWQKVSDTGGFGDRIPFDSDRSHAAQTIGGKSISGVPTKKRKKRLFIKAFAMVGFGVVTLLGAKFMLKTPVQPDVPQTVPKPSLSLADILTLMDSNLEGARLELEKLVDSNPAFYEPSKSVKNGHVGPIERVWGIGEPAAFVTTGYDKEPKLWQCQNDEVASTSIDSLQMKTLAQLPENVVNRHAVAVDPAGRFLWVGAGTQLHQVPLNTDEKKTPIRSWELDSPLLCIAIHPKQSSQIAVALEDKRVVIVDAMKSGQSPEQPIGTLMTDFAQELCFLGNGSMMVVRYENGVVVGVDWNELAHSNIDEAAVTPEETGVEDAETLLAVQDDLIWIGHYSGFVTKYRWSDPASPPQRLFGDSVDSSPISRMVWGDRSSSASSLVTGSDSGNVVIWSTENEKELSKKIPISRSSIRALATSSSGRWIVAGAEQTVVVIDSQSPQTHLARLSIDKRTAESILIDEEAKRLLIGCENGELISMDWEHCKLLTLLPTPIQTPSPSTDHEDRVTQRL